MVFKLIRLILFQENLHNKRRPHIDFPQPNILPLFRLFDSFQYLSHTIMISDLHCEAFQGQEICQ